MGIQNLAYVLKGKPERSQQFIEQSIYNGGRGGIRTHETLARLLVFKTSAFNRSATRPLTQRFTRKFDLNQELAVT